MQNVITSAEIDQWLREGRNTVSLDTDAVFTTMATGMARQHNLNIIRKASTTEHSVLTRESSGQDQPLQGYTNPLLNEKVIEEWRQEFPILQNVIHVGNCSQAPQSRRVRDEINKYLDNWLTVGMDWDYWVEAVNKAKVEFATLINADVSEIAVCSSVSEAVAALVGAFSFNGPRNKIVTTEAEFPTVGHVLLAHQKLGAKVEFLPLSDDGVIALDDYDRYIDEQTLLTVATQVYYLNGFQQNIAAIAGKAHAKGSYFFVDCYQGIGTIPIDVKAMDIDFLATGMLKYLLGIPGIAFLYVKKELAADLKPLLTGWFGQENPFSFQVKVLDYAQGARRFDTGTPPILAGFAAKAALEIINEIGVPNINERVQYLSHICWNEALARGLEPISPRDITQKGGTTAFRVPDSHAVEGALKKRNIIATARGDVIRIAHHFFTRPQDLTYTLDELVDILGDMP